MFTLKNENLKFEKKYTSAFMPKFQPYTKFKMNDTTERNILSHIHRKMGRTDFKFRNKIVYK